MRPLRILLADDDPSNREVASIMLRSAGHSVTPCPDGAEVLARCAADPGAFDLIMLDVMMPGMSGLSLSERLRADPGTRLTPIICVSGRAREEDRDAGLKAGCDVYLTKPYRRKQLLAILAELFGS